MLMKKLKIEPQPVITSECWSYYKFSIVQNQEYFNSWLVGHQRIYINENGFSGFGEMGNIYPMSYYNEILEMNEVSIYDIPPSQLVDFLIDQINNDKYIVLDVNSNRIYNTKTHSFKLHEILIYGYDVSRKVFIISLLKNGMFKETEIGFNTVISAYEDVKNYYLQDKGKLLNRRDWFFGITLLSAKKDYSNPNAIYDFLKKIDYEIEGNIYTRCIYGEDDNLLVAQKFHTGISTMKCLSKLIKQNITTCDERDKKRYKKACLLICENQHIILRSMNWFLENIKSDDNLELIILEYERCCKQMKTNVLLFYKYFENENIQGYYKISENLELLCKLEKEILIRFRNCAKSLYIKRLNINN